MAIAVAVGLFIVVCTAAALLRMVGRCIFRFAFSPVIERIGGAVVGALTTALILAAALVGLNLIPHAGLRQVLREDSRIAPRVLAAAPAMYREIAARVPSLPEWPEPPPADGEPSAEPAAHPPPNIEKARD